MKKKLTIYVIIGCISGIIGCSPKVVSYTQDKSIRSETLFTISLTGSSPTVDVPGTAGNTFGIPATPGGPYDMFDAAGKVKVVINSDFSDILPAHLIDTGYLATSYKMYGQTTQQAQLLATQQQLLRVLQRQLHYLKLKIS
jgi:hypothetical protein